MNFVLLLLLMTAIILLPTEYFTRIRIRTRKKGDAEERPKDSFRYESSDRSRENHLHIIKNTFIRSVVWLIALVILIWTMAPSAAFILFLIAIKLIMAPFELLFFGRGSDNWRNTVKALLFLVLLILPVTSLVYYQQVQRVANAAYFNSQITVTTGFPFKNAIPDENVRLVTEEFATSRARSSMSEFGSNREIKSTHITLINGRLVWVSTVGSTNVYSENFLAGFIVIDANDPNASPIIVHQTFIKGEGLWWSNTIQFGAYLDDSNYIYGGAYPTTTPDGQWRYILTRESFGYDLIDKAIPPLVYDETGTVTNQFTSFKDTPPWVTQPYSETWIESMISQWGQFRRGATFDWWAGGFPFFAAPSRDRVERSEDTRFIIDPDTNELVALIAVHPTTSDQTLAGMFVIRHNSMTYYDFHARHVLN